ncbi:MAG TPA: hypothetical protein DDW52_14555 [Planctomycetaceae bacterium]|nr:hypothetical protein [Planctomycetaceae bacterium]
MCSSRLAHPSESPHAWLFQCTCSAIAALLAFAGTTGRLSQAKDSVSDEAIREIITETCLDCHSQDDPAGNLELDNLLEAYTTSAAPDEQGVNQWWQVLKNVRAETMPPPDSGYDLSHGDRARLLDWVKFNAMGLERENPDPGQVTLRRLNRREYRNTIRDLMGIDFNADIVFPPDDTGFGFDTVGDVLGFSDVMIEKYLASAKQIVDQAVPKQTKVMPVQFEKSDVTTVDGRSADRLEMSQPADIRLEFEVQEAAEYRLELAFETDGTFEYCADRCQLDVRLNSSPVHSEIYEWDEDHDWELTHLQELQPGTHHISIRVLPATPADAKDKDHAKSFIEFEAVRIAGPVAKDRWTNPPGYDRFFHRSDLPNDEAKLKAYARDVLERFALRAFRRPPPERTLDRLTELSMVVACQEGRTFEQGVAAAMMSVLASPRFLLRAEATSEDSAGQYPRLDDYSLASRLSYMLWSSMPDEELFELAATGKLADNIDQQVARMLADEKSKAFISGFGSQWLRTSDIEKVNVDPLAALGLREEYERWREELKELRDLDSPTETQADRQEELLSKIRGLRDKRDLFDDQTRAAMRAETEELLAYVIRERRPLSELLDPGYTFLNQRLAGLYEIEGVEGEQMQRVELPTDSPRGGILSHGSMLTLTSNPTRTSPVKRGLFVLENILAMPSPPAPPNVPELEDAKDRFGGRDPTIKELLAVHREAALCSSCHNRMDPLGLALENFNALGMWRDTEGGQPIEPAGKLITGEQFRNVVELRGLLAIQRKRDFYRCVTQKLFTYGIGRGVEYFDESSCDQIVDQLIAGQKQDFVELITLLARTPAFQQTRKQQKSGIALAN